MLKINRALLSVSDKSDLIVLAKKLVENNVNILSTGGTHKALSNENISVTEVSDVTKFPEIMNGRVKTLHPKIHGGILGRRGTDEKVMDQYDIHPIDLLVVNLYPFKETIRNKDVEINKAIENIDIGGPAMIRAAAKNHENIIVIVDPDDYSEFIKKYENHELTLEYRQYLATKAFGHTASYDVAIYQYFNSTILKNNISDQFFYTGNLITQLRYGENPHQNAAFYSDDVNFDQNTATVTYDQNKIDSKALAEAINAATDYDVSDKKAEEKKSGSFLGRFFGSS